MKNLILFLSFCLIISFPVLAIAETLTFQKFGYDDITLTGPTPAVTLFLKVGENIDSSKSYIVLDIEASPVLNYRNSYLTVLIWDKPAFTVRLSDLGNRLLIPLRRFDLSFSEFIKLDIKANLTITMDRCYDIATNGLWIKIRRSSFVNVEFKKRPDTKLKISNFISFLQNGGVIVIPSNLSTVECEGAVWVYSYLRKLTGKDFDISTYEMLSDSVENLVIVSRFDKIPDKYKKFIGGKFLSEDGLIYVYSEQSGKFKQNVLVLTGFSDEGLSKTLKTFLNRDVLQSSFNGFLLVRNAMYEPRDKLPLPPYKITFRKLGFTSGRLEGIGNLRYVYSFKNSDLGFSPNKLTITINAVYSPVRGEVQRTYFNVYFNGTLIESKRLSEEGKVSYSFDVDRFILLKTNTITVEFVYYPTSDECKNLLANFFCMLDDERSYIDVSSFYRPDELSFVHFPEMFGYGETVGVIGGKVTLQKVKSLAKIVYFVNLGIKEFEFYPPVYFSSYVDDEILKSYNLILVLDSDEQLINKFKNLPLKPERGFRILSSATGRVLYALWDTTSIGVGEVFYGEKGNPVFLVFGIGRYADERIYQLSKSLEAKFPDISGNIGIVDGEKSYFFRIEAGLLKVQYPGERTFLDIFNQYKIFIIIFAWALFLALLAYVFWRGRKMARKIMEKR